MTDDTRIQLRLHFGDQLTFGPGKADLLALIAEKGSIAAAGGDGYELQAGVVSGRGYERGV